MVVVADDKLVNTVRAISNLADMLNELLGVLSARGGIDPGYDWPSMDMVVYEVKEACAWAWPVCDKCNNNHDPDDDCDYIGEG